jgi:hypothetical protein
LRVAALIVMLAPVVAIACEDDTPDDCTGRGGVCSVGGLTASPVFVTCEGEQFAAEQCQQAAKRTSERAAGSCCHPRKCAEGRGICMTPCASGRRIYASDSDCGDADGSNRTDCCEP